MLGIFGTLSYVVFLYLWILYLYFLYLCVWHTGKCEENSWKKFNIFFNHFKKNSNFSHIFFPTLLNFSPTCFLQLFPNLFSSTFPQFFSNFSPTFPQLFPNFDSTFTQLFPNLFLTFPNLFSTFYCHFFVIVFFWQCFFLHFFHFFLKMLWDPKKKLSITQTNQIVMTGQFPTLAMFWFCICLLRAFSDLLGL